MASGITVDFKTKNELREEDIQLTKLILYGRRRYQNVYNKINQLSEAYDVCKSNCSVLRYTDLKEMIKECVTDEVLQETAKCSIYPTDEQTNTPFLQAVEDLFQFDHDKTEAEEEVERMHKDELISDIEKKKKKRLMLQSKMVRLHRKLKQLREDYENSKQFKPIRRYRLMKDMIKSLIRDESLKIDSE